MRYSTGDRFNIFMFLHNWIQLSWKKKYAKEKNKLCKFYHNLYKNYDLCIVFTWWLHAMQLIMLASFLLIIITHLFIIFILIFKFIIIKFCICCRMGFVEKVFLSNSDSVKRVLKIATEQKINRKCVYVSYLM